ncbi:hypothetical protein ILUMI_22764 [Ignelater luminosus]|uniref:Uncharacterized protein n=1 Tax=Ignelater luminosus TaxID=2038154 RepID=A0A8K0C9H3_IGNLU|nr:hypothetical protein ILUMI_22764 [Ignelater luminosus]
MVIEGDDYCGLIETSTNASESTFTLTGHSDGLTVNQIDVLIKREEEQNIKKIRTYKGPDVDLDHFMVGVKMTQILPVKYGENIKKAMSTVEETRDIERSWNEIKSKMKEATKEWKNESTIRSDKG